MIVPAYMYRAVVRSIYDADTIRADIDLGFGIWSMNRSLRLFGIDAPELRGDERPKGLTARDALIARLPEDTPIIVETYKDRTGKYGRLLASVWLGDENINEWLVRNGLAERYED